MYLSETRPVVDGDGRVYAVFAGHEANPNFKAEVHDPAVEAMEEALRQCSASDAEDSHHCGTLYQEYAGQSHGGGQFVPGTLQRGSVKAVLMLWLLSQAAFIRLAGFATGVFAGFAPDLYEYYAINMCAFYAKNPRSRRPFLNSIWSACTFNLGPQTCALGHRDYANLSFGLCAITALGNFDYTKGGHLILWDAKLILEFPPGTTILIPSAAIYHSNIPVAPGERRFSFTQYTAGGIFRWVQHGFRSEDSYWSSLSAAQRMAEVQKMAGRWEDGVNHYAYEEELMD
ncbi:hypothetical protein B0H14DRAFT_2338710 [Mycena olivaceomarginata]|nr:hypothetical protein B0H14DRAFT_2338710 [Mycena olivaceomarginata]